MAVTEGAESTGRPSDRRKLIAVVYADMVGYSRLIGLDDVGTLDRLRKLRSEVIDPAIREHGGRIVQTGGDFLLIVFDSIDGAVRCAVQVQQQVPIHDGDQLADRAIRFRMGINLGDAIADGTDLHGDAVNVVARLQAECPPGAICVSRAVRDHVHERLNLVFEGIGALNLKNIARPVEASVIRVDDEATRALVRNTRQGMSSSGKPSVAVLPFENLSGDPDQQYFADGLTEDILTALARFNQLMVIARNSTFVYKGRSVSIADIGRDLNVRYVLEGSVRRSGERVRVTAQLIEADPSYSLAYALLARTLWVIVSLHRTKPSPDELVGYADLARTAVRLGQADSETLCAAANMIALPGGQLEEGIAIIDRALALNPNSADALAVSGMLRAYAGDTEMAFRHLKEADRLSPPGAYIITKAFGFYLACFVDGDYAGVLDWTAQSLRRHPTNAVTLRYRAAALGRLDEARQTVDRLLLASPGLTISRCRRHVEVEMQNPFKRPGVVDAYYEGLRRAGLPE